MARIGAQDRIEARERRRRARERTRQRRSDEIRAAGRTSRDDRRSREERHAAMDAVRQERRAEVWDERQADRHNSWENQYGQRAQRRQMRMMEAHARRRAQDLDFIDRVNSGEVEYTGDDLMGEVKSGVAWSQGSQDAYDYYNENRGAIKRGEMDFFYEDYVPRAGRNTGPDGNRNPRRRRPSYEQYMGQYYDPNLAQRSHGNPHRRRNNYNASRMPRPGESGFRAGDHAR